MPFLSEIEQYHKLRDILSDRFHVELPKDLDLRLQAFHEEVLEWNDYAGLLSSRTTVENLWEHTLDSLALIPYLDRVDSAQRPHWDIGTGGGFPGIVISLAVPKLEIVLVERNTKKSTFLERQIRELKSKNVSVVTDSYPETRPAKPFTMTARAIEKPAAFIKAMESVWMDGSIFLSQFKKSEILFGEKWTLELVEDGLREFRRGKLYKAERYPG